MKYYAVKKGRKPGIYTSWDQCQKQVKGYSGGIYKKFDTEGEAEDFISGNEEKIEEIDELNLREDQAVAYVDGSFNSGSMSYSYGLVYFDSQGKRTFKDSYNDPEMASMRNVSGELKGAVEAMKLARDENKKELYLHYDYRGIEDWALGNWKTNKEGTRKYKEFYDSIEKNLKVHFIKVKAHSGIEYNEEADRLAKEALS